MRNLAFGKIRMSFSFFFSEVNKAKPNYYRFKKNSFRCLKIFSKAQISELRSQVNSLNSLNSELEARSSGGYQKSAFMEEYEEHGNSVDPSDGSLNDYIHLKKEMKRLSEDNSHLLEQNRALSARVKSLQLEKSDLAESLELELRNERERARLDKLAELQLRHEHAELRLKLEEKSAETLQLAEQISELNSNINTFKSNDSTLISELERNSNELLSKLQACNTELAESRLQSGQLRGEKFNLEKVIAAQTQAMDKMQSDLRSSGEIKTEKKEEVILSCSICFFSIPLNLSAIVCKNRPNCNLLLLNLIFLNILTIFTSNWESILFFSVWAKKSEFGKIQHCPF